MKKLTVFIMALMMSLVSFAVKPETPADTTIKLSEITVSGLYRNSVNVGYLILVKTLISENHGQEPSHLFASMPNIFSMNDNGTDFGYGYFRIRGLDQTRINVTLDGMPWNEAEDYGTYFANSPDIMSSLHTIKVERGTSSTNNGTASSGGSINMESIDLLKDTTSYAYVGGGSYTTYKTSVIYNSGLFNKHHAIHVKATQQQTNGFKKFGFNNSQAFTLKYGFFFNDKHQIEILSLNGRHRNGQGWLGNTRNELSVDSHSNGNVKEDDDEWFQTINKIQYKAKFADNIFFTASSYLQYQNGWYNMDLDNYTYRMTQTSDTYWYDAKNSPTNIRYSYGLKHYLYGGNAATKFYFNDLTLTIGTNIYAYQREHFMDDRLKDHYSNISPNEFYKNVGHKLDVNGFAAASYNLHKFNFGANVQYRYVNFRYKDKLNPAQNFDQNKFGTKWNFINCGANIDYNINKLMKVYVRYAMAHREPTRTDMFGGNEYFTGDITTNKAELSHDVEAGYEVNTNKVKANVNLYYMKFNNERVLNGQYGLNGLPLHDTADKSYRMGAEGCIDWNFWNNFHYATAISWSRNKIDTPTYNDKTHILTPAFTFNNDIYYEAKNWKAGINNHYHSSMYADQDNTLKIPNFFTLNIYGSYIYKKAEFGARINNITNKVNYFNAVDSRGTSVNDILWFRNGGINFMADIKYYF
jgi:iron complex outermembrane receptor protein